jgi:BirA family biotin operon repressor/biotin-[acetyl-CoA-carboxylase] ligase
VSDLSGGELAAALPGRPVRSFPALLSTDAQAGAWARAGAPDGALVVADYQVSPRGRGGLPWTARPGVGLGFSLVLHPEVPEAREGWLYLVAAAALLDVLGSESRLRWPDEVHVASRRAGAAGVSTSVTRGRVDWAVLTVLVEDVRPPRAPVLAAIVAAVQRRLEQSEPDVLAFLRARCSTLGRRVTARLVPLGPAAVGVTGEAVDLRDDGALVLLTDDRRRVAVRPQALGLLDPSPAT